MTPKPWRLFGIPCHVCGLPAEWFDDGVTLPCGCGTRDNGTSAVARIASAPTTPGSPDVAVVAQIITEDRDAQPHDPEDEAWREIVNCLVALQRLVEVG